MEYVEMRSLSSKAWELGEQLAKYVWPPKTESSFSICHMQKLFCRLHLSNQSLLASHELDSSIHKMDDAVQPVKKFGFEVDTCCGFLSQNNTWQDDWVVCVGKRVNEPFNFYYIYQLLDFLRTTAWWTNLSDARKSAEFTNFYNISLLTIVFLVERRPRSSIIVEWTAAKTPSTFRRSRHQTSPHPRRPLVGKRCRERQGCS